MITLTSPWPDYDVHHGVHGGRITTYYNKSLKRSPIRRVILGSNDALPTLRDIYRAADTSEGHNFQGLEGSCWLDEFQRPQLDRFQELKNWADPAKIMAYRSCYEQLPSYAPSPARAQPSLLKDMLALGPGVKFTGRRPSLVVQDSQTGQLKSTFEKPLPTNLMSCHRELAEPHEAVGAQNFKANPLLSSNLVFEHIKSLDTVQTGQPSSTSSDYHTAASRLSENPSPDSISTGEHGIATATPIQAVTNRMFRIVTERAYQLSPKKHTLNTPGSSKIPRHGTLLQNGQLRQISPSRSSRLQDKINRSTLRGRQALSMHGHDSPFKTYAPPYDHIIGLQKTSDSYDTSIICHTSSGAIRGLGDDVFEESVTEEGLERTSSKYGFNIRESFDAREAIMGQTGLSDSSPRMGSRFSRRSIPTLTDQNGQIYELDLKLASPNSGSSKIFFGDLGTSDSASGPSRHPGAAKPIVHTPPHPPRTSSLPKDYSVKTEVMASEEQRPLIPKTKTEGTDSSKAGQKAAPSSFSKTYPFKIEVLTPEDRQHLLSNTEIEDMESAEAGKKAAPTPLPINHPLDSGVKIPKEQKPRVMKTKTEGTDSSETHQKPAPTSRMSLLRRQTAASSARASFIAKKVSGSQPTTTRIPQSRTLASLGNVGEGMKTLGKKVGNIMPQRRSIILEATFEEAYTLTAGNQDGPHRKASRLLTTYKNSGMEEKVVEIPTQSVHDGDSSIQLQPTDRHEPDEAEKEKNAWREGSRNVAQDTETGHFVHFGQQYSGNDNENGDGLPPPPPSPQIRAGGHYVEDTVRDGRDEGADNDAASPTNQQRVQNAENDALHVSRHGSAGINATLATGEQNAPPNNAEDNARARRRSVDDRLDQMLAESIVRAHDILDYATSLTDSPFRNRVIESVAHLTEGVMYTRQARMELLRSSQALDEATVLLGENTQRMVDLLERFSGIPH